MANNYSAVITIPLAQEALFLEGNYVIYGQFQFISSGSSFFTITEIIDAIVIAAEGEWGGDLSYVRTTDATNAYYTFTWSGITPTLLGFPQQFTANLYLAGEPASLIFTSAICLNCPEADLTICTECRQSNQQACADTYFIEAGLTSGDTYYAAITDRNNDVYIQAIIADASGNLTIDATAPEFPVGFWLAESGNKSITVYEDEEMTIVSELTVGANVYTCMILSLQYYYTTTT